MFRFARIVMPTVFFMATATAANALDGVVASIKPVHSLVAAVMGDTGTPTLLVQGAASPHGFSLKPSQASELEQARLVFWIGHELEPFLEKPMETIATQAQSVELMDADGITRLAPREGGMFESDEDHDGDHGTEEDDHGHGEIDPHLWLDPENAKVFVREIERALSAADPANAAAYRANGEATLARLEVLSQDVRTTLASAKGRGFVVFHDAYHYFENRFDVRASGSITVSPDVMPGAARIADIRARMKRLGAVCVFAEPQFEPRLIDVIVEGTGARTGVLDPLGAALDDGPELYFKLIRNMASSMRDCLAAAG